MSFRKIIAANWKMNKTSGEAVEFFGTLESAIGGSNNCETIICPPFTLLDYVGKEFERLNIKLGAQNCHFEKSGAFTGEISAEMLKDVGVQYVIIGHSERRKHFFETDEIINKKVKFALTNGLKVIFCVGESAEVRQNGNVREFIFEQLKNGLSGLNKEDIDNVVIAYEPIWAIGSGITVTFDEADEIGKFIKDFVIGSFNCDVRVLYGGSVSADNVHGFLSLKNIDGALVGGASLDAKSFAKIINAV